MALRDVVAKLTGTATRAIADLNEVDAGLRRQLGDLQGQRAALLTAPPPRAEVLAALRQLVDEEGETWRSTLVAGLAESVRAGESPSLPHELLPFAAFAPDLLIESIEEHLAAGDWQDGPATADRPRLLDELNERRRALEAEHARLVDAAGESGVVLRHLDSEVGRRAQQRLARESATRFNEANAGAIRRGTITPREVS